MKPLEILSALPKWANAAPESLLDSPAWAMPCRLGDASATLRAAEVRPGESLDLAVLLDGERHLLSIADSPRFADLHALWATRAEVPEPILLALVEKECGVLLQLVENAVRRQLKVEGLASAGPDERTFFMQVEDVVFGLTRSPVVEAALGQLRFVDTAHQSVREEPLPCETEVASFVLSAADIASIAVGDALLLPEVGTVPPRLVVDGRFLVDENGVAPFSDDGRLRIDLLDEYITEHTRLISLAHVSNVLGTVNPVKDITALAHSHGIAVLVDAAQSAPHIPVDVSDIGCDFLAFSGHKMYGPTGVGVLYGREEWLDRLPPYQGGGEMIGSVSWEKTTWNELPFKFEAGTPDYVATHGLATAIDYITGIGLEQIHAHEQLLLSYCTQLLQQISGLRIIGPGFAEKDAVVSFVVEGVHPLDLGTLLDQLGVAVRTGHHCAQPLIERMGLTSTVRASFAMYNTKQEVETLAAALRRVIPMLL